MASQAALFPRVAGHDAFASHDVLDPSDEFHVGGVYAQAGSTQMVDMEALRDWSPRKDVGDSVGMFFATIDPDLSVSKLWTDVARPEPACIRPVDLRPEAIPNRAPRTGMFATSEATAEFASLFAHGRLPT
jgi:hypothetical protein